MSRYNDASDFYYAYKQLTDSERDKFTRVANKILGVQYLTHKKEEDRSDYFFLVKHLKMIKPYFALLGYELDYYEVEKVIALTNPGGANRLRLKKMETILLLVIRLLYQNKLREDLAETISITLADIHFEVERIGVFDSRLTKTDLSAALRLFKRYNLINFQSPKFDDDHTPILLYPTLLYAARFENIHAIEARLSSYDRSQEEDVDEDTDTD